MGNGYHEKLRHHYHELTRDEKDRYQREDRAGFSAEERFFFEGCPLIPGQMYLAEREALYNAILQLRPANCFEIGTNMGGGSTFFIAAAFSKLGVGQIITLEKRVHEYEFAKGAYRQFAPKLVPFVTFLLGDHPKYFTPYIQARGNVVDSVFLDGGPDPEDTLEQYEFFRPFWKPGSILILHDWDTSRAQKMDLLRPLVTNDPQWSLVLELGAGANSVGFVIWQRQ